MNRLRVCGAAVAALCLIAATPAVAAEDGETLVRRSDEQLKSDTEVIRYRMEIVSAGGEVEQVREFVTYSKNGEDEERTLQKFQSPPVFEGTGLLIVDDNRGQNDIWLYLPSSRRIRRIAGQEKSNQYMGTEYSYEDFEDYQISEYDFRLLRSTACKGTDGECHVVEAKPSTAEEREASGYSKKVYWIETESLYPVRVELFGDDGDIVKVETASGLRRIAGYWRPTRQAMKDRRSGRETRLEIVEDKIDQSVEDFYVSKRFLRR